MVFLNDTLSSIIATNFGVSRVDGRVTALLSDPWHPSAIANISNIQMSSMNIIPPMNQSLADSDEDEKVIFNSLFDDCSRGAGADAGCGRNLQCNNFTDGKASCGPIPRFKSLLRLLDRVEANDTDSIVVSTFHQTCGRSSRYNNTCSQDTLYGPLTCSQVDSTVDGKKSKKWICLEDFSMDFQKRDACLGMLAKSTLLISTLISLLSYPCSTLGASCALSSYTPTPTTTVAEKDKRGVRLISRPFATNFCYSGCGGARII